ncbi:PqqD family protein [Frankia sp. AgB1.9]|uniref:PqqD family protein n=1 Tax=unclassified Frankia TaxID=2632575 RepID=UPI001933A1DB|nr:MULTISPECIES: PqqD family protein [unclassified Frankia]MBL7491214.1 PqqD family protein [Frankia sp. AgW1.1]MBL7548179.1 PqqD family protein [Frankia sp. AgB1.9]MBL7618425.1 PqqD family protein [Frankia sp. AgB1.8]
MPDASQQAPAGPRPATRDAGPSQATGHADQRQPGSGPGTDRADDHDEVRIGPGVQAADIGGEIVLLHPDDGAYFALNETGAQLWRQLGPTGVPRGAAIRRAAATVSDGWLIDQPHAEHDLRELLDELARRRLVTVTPRPAS